MIAVVGPDGSGKSTFIELLQKALSHTLVKETIDVRILHFRPNIFPNIKKLISGKNYNEKCEAFTSPHRAKPAGFVSSFSRITYYWFDYLCGYWLRIRRHCVAGKVYIFDRYCYDFVVDPYRSRVKLPDWLRSVYLKFTPEPDIVFFLHCDAKTVYARKQELTMAEIERQLQVYRKLSDNSDRFVILDANKAPAELCNDALRHLMKISFDKL
jgi:thymidylate kinase